MSKYCVLSCNSFHFYKFKEVCGSTSVIFIYSLWKEHMEVRGQLAGIGSLLLQCGS